MIDLTTEQFEAAKDRGEQRLRGPRAESAQYDTERDRVIVRLTTGIEIGFAPCDAEGLAHASPSDLSTIEVEAFGLGIHFPRLDADFYVPALLEGVLGPKRVDQASIKNQESGKTTRTQKLDNLMVSSSTDTSADADRFDEKNLWTSVIQENVVVLDQFRALSKKPKSEQIELQESSIRFRLRR